jgi:hypothetical protein
LFPPTRETRLRPEADAGILYDAFHTIDVRCRQVVTEHCVEGIRADEKRIGDLMELALMLLPLRFVSSAEFDRLTPSDKMTHPG